MLGVSGHQDLILNRGAVPLPLRGEGLNTAPHGEPVLHIAGSEALPPGTGMPDTLWGGLEGFRDERNPSAQLPARTAASDGHTANTRACAKRRAQVCGDSTVRSDGQWETTKSGARVGTSSTADAVPLPLIGEGLSAVESGRDFECRVLLTPLFTLVFGNLFPLRGVIL